MGAISHCTFKGDSCFISVSAWGDYFKIRSYFLCHSCRLWSIYADVKAFFLNKGLQKLDCFLMPKDIQYPLAHFIVFHYSSTTVVLIYTIFLCGLCCASLHGCYHMPAKLDSTGWLVLTELSTFCHPVVHWLWKWEYGLLREKKWSDWLFLVYTSDAMDEAARKRHDHCWARTMKKYYLCAAFPTDSIFDAGLKCSQSLMHGKCSGCSRQFWKHQNQSPGKQEKQKVKSKSISAIKQTPPTCRRVASSLKQYV